MDFKHLFKRTTVPCLCTCCHFRIGVEEVRVRGLLSNDPVYLVRSGGRVFICLELESTEPAIEAFIYRWSMIWQWFHIVGVLSYYFSRIVD